MTRPYWSPDKRVFQCDGMPTSITTVAVRYEQDVVLARQRTRQIAKELGFDSQDQTRLATAVSELARNAFGYAGGGKVEFSLDGDTAPQIFLIRIVDEGPGIANLKEILAGNYRSTSGMGLGLIGARRLVDQCDIYTGPNRGTQILLKKLLPRRTPLITGNHAAKIADTLAQQRPESALDEVKRQNQELLRALDEARERQEELARVNQELEDTNRGVVALYAELDERANHLRRADEMKTSFLSNMSHEFRTPLNSILALSQILLERTDGELTGEQEIQIGFIRKGAETLLELVNDLLDLAKIEAGKIEVQPVEFSVANLFSALRGMLRPLLIGESVSLVFEEPADLPALFSDESKISQILRNFIANALKFTEHGEVRVSATWSEARKTVTFAVADTGIGIAAADRAKIFEEFTQIHHPIQSKSKGTGLGLPLCRKLANLLGGTIELTSELGVGSTFTLILPIEGTDTDGDARAEAEGGGEWHVDGNRVPVLILEDEPETRLIYESFLRDTPFQMFAVSNLRQARNALRRIQPHAIVLDILLRGEETWKWLVELKNNVATSAIPVLVATHVDDERKGYALGADEYHVKPLKREVLIASLQRLTGRTPAQEEGKEPEIEGGRKRVLIVDDQAAARYVLAKLIDGKRYLVRQAKNGAEGLRMAKEVAPDFIFLDLDMPDIWGFDVLKALKADPVTESIPVAIVTSLSLSDEDRARVECQACAVISKSELSRARIDQLLTSTLTDSLKRTVEFAH
jgi:signal transduction histidine kinase/DNA-binding response OmpR family regulator